MGVFLGMTYYLLRAGRLEKTHLRDLGIAFAYLILSFVLDYTCVKLFTPFKALLVGDAVVMTFTFLVSKQLWFQRLLGIFVPLVFFTCSFGHLMEGLSFWQLTYPINVPWTMVTADIGFAILVNATRFPAFIRGHDIENEILTVKAESAKRNKFFKDVLSSVTDGKLRLVTDAGELPKPPPLVGKTISLDVESLSYVRQIAANVWIEKGFPVERKPEMLMAVGESIMNAVVHGMGGTVEIHADDVDFQVWVSDRGPGIQLDRLPRATLEKGFSTAGSLGQGFFIILQTVDRLFLMTEPTIGTTIVVEFDREPLVREFSFLNQRQPEVA